MDSRIWLRHDEASGEQYVVSTHRPHLDLAFINAAFATDEIFWAKTMPLAELNKMLDYSLTLGLYIYRQSEGGPRLTETTAAALPAAMLQQIGMARYITDRVTFGYLTDVVVLPEYRDKGLGSWLVQACGEVVDGMRRDGFLRGTVLFTSNPRAVPFYENLLGVKVFDQSGEIKVLATSDREGGDITKTT